MPSNIAARPILRLRDLYVALPVALTTPRERALELAIGVRSARILTQLILACASPVVRPTTVEVPVPLELPTAGTTFVPTPDAMPVPTALPTVGVT